MLTRRLLIIFPTSSNMKPGEGDPRSRDIMLPPGRCIILIVLMAILTVFGREACDLSRKDDHLFLDASSCS